jgi:transcriptional regulator with XRE-family HTH domain
MLNRTEIIAKRLGRRIRQIRVEQETSQESLAYEAGLERAYYWKLENGRINVTLETLVKIADALGVDIAELFYKPSSKNKAMQNRT